MTKSSYVPRLDLGTVLTTGAGVTLTDNDTVEVAVTPTIAHVTEGGAATMVVSLAREAAKDVSVSWSTADDTAQAGTDYTAQAATTLTFAPGEISKTISVQTTEDNVEEPEQYEYFDVHFSTVEGSFATLATDSYEWLSRTTITSPSM